MRSGFTTNARLWAIVLILSTFAYRHQLPALEDYRRELADEPKGKTAREARTLLEQGEFERARAQGSILALRAFLSEFPDGAHHFAAEALLEAARWNEA